MNVEVKESEKNKIILEIEVDDDVFEDALNKSYLKNRKNISIPGFRKGKAPRRFIEKYYGEGIFYEDAINIVCPEAYDKAIEEKGIEPVDRPEIDIISIGSGQKFKFSAEVWVKPEVNLSEYKGVEVEKVEYKIADDDVEKEILVMREKNSRMVEVTDRPVAEGDIAVIDYEGFVDGEAFEGGKGENYHLTIGSGHFIPGFEEQLVGKNTGDEFTIDVKFPEEYHSEELKGKDAQFKVKINGIKVKELPEPDDEFAKDVSEFDTYAELFEDVKKRLLADAEARQKRDMEDRVLEAIADKTEIDIPECMIEQQADRMLQEYAYRLSSQGITLEQYAQYTGLDIDKIKEQFRENAQKAVKSNLILEKIAKVESIEVTDEEMEAEYAKMAEQYKMETEKFKDMMKGMEDSIKNDLKITKTLEFLVENAKLKEEKKKKGSAKK